MIFFDEGPGFIFVKPLGEGAYGNAALVLCVGDGKYYVRKEELHTQFRDPHTAVNEIQNARHVAHVSGTTKMNGWMNYVCRRSGRIFGVSYWDYYTAGTLSDIKNKSRKSGVLIPQQWICSWLAKMVEITLGIHKAGVCHRDGHTGNWFLTICNKHKLPEIGLGDFGLSTRHGPCKQQWFRLCQEDFDSICQCVFSILPHRAGYSRIRGLVERMRDQVQHSTNEWRLHESMESIKDTANHILTQFNKLTLEQTRLVEDGTPHNGILNRAGYWPYVHYDRSMVKNFKSFLVAEAHDGKVIKLSGQPAELAGKYSRSAHGGWTQGNMRVYKVKR